MRYGTQDTNCGESVPKLSLRYGELDNRRVEAEYSRRPLETSHTVQGISAQEHRVAAADSKMLK